jgi:hypothetical protein
VKKKHRWDETRVTWDEQYVARVNALTSRACLAVESHKMNYRTSRTPSARGVVDVVLKAVSRQRPTRPFWNIFSALKLKPLNTVCVSAAQNLVNQAIFFGLLARHPVVAVAIALDFLECFAAVFGINRVK